MENNTYFVPMENRTHYDELRAHVYKKHDGWHWEIRDYTGQRMAAGFEFKLKVAYQEAALVVRAIRLWSSCSRGTLTPSNDGRRWFTFENTESYNRYPALVPTRKQIDKLTKTKKKGKVKK